MKSGWSTMTPQGVQRSRLTNGAKSTPTHLWSLAMLMSGTKGEQTRNKKLQAQSLVIYTHVHVQIF
jgi:hypothetical protein